MHQGSPSYCIWNTKAIVDINSIKPLEYDGKRTPMPHPANHHTSDLRSSSLWPTWQSLKEAGTNPKKSAGSNQTRQNHRITSDYSSVHLVCRASMSFLYNLSYLYSIIIFVNYIVIYSTIVLCSALHHSYCI